MATNGRLRDYLTAAEVRALLRAAKSSKRYGARNSAMILLAYRHGFRASELVSLRLGDVDLAAGTIHCRREKGSKPSVHPMKADERAAIDCALAGRKGSKEEWVFTSERTVRYTTLDAKRFRGLW